MLVQIVSNWKWIITVSIFIGLMRPLHHVFMSGINPIFSNSVILTSFIFSVFMLISLSLKKQISWAIIILTITLTILIGPFLGQLFAKLLFPNFRQ